MHILYLLKYPNWLIYTVFRSLDLFFNSIKDLSFLLIIPGSEQPLRKINMVDIINNINIQIIKKLLIFVTKNYTI